MMCRKFEVNTLSNNGVITFCDFLSHNSTGYSTPYVGMTRFFSFSPYIGIGAKSRNRPKIDKTRLCIAKYTIYIL